MKLTITKIHNKICLMKVIRDNYYIFGFKKDAPPLSYVSAYIKHLPIVCTNLNQFTIDEMNNKLPAIVDYTVEAEPHEEWDEEANQPWLKEAKAWFDQLSDIEKYYVEQLGRHWNRGPRG